MAKNIKKTKTEYGRPIANWLNETEYTNEATRIRWGWEFLRRNPGYQQLWETEIAAFPKPGLDSGKEQNINYVSNYRLTDVFANNIDGYSGSTQLGIFAKDTCCGNKYLASVYGINNLINLYSTSIDDHFLRYELVNRLYSAEVSEFLKSQKTITISKVPGYFLAYLFDLSDSIPKQLEEARIKLEEQKRADIDFLDIPYTHVRFHPDNFAEYLRVLDARAIDISYQDIANTLFAKRVGSTKQFVADTVKQALRHRDIRYKNLLI